VTITPLAQHPTRDMVTDAMLMAGEAAAKFAITRALPFPFTTQPAPDVVEHPADIASMSGYRRHLRPGVVKASPDLHAGLGLASYSRVTSPLRRYLDLVAHQQIRASLTGGQLLDEQEIMGRIGASAAMTGTVQKIERLSNLHWTLVFLLQNPDWTANGIVVEIRLRVIGVDLPGQTAHFTIASA
jgi:exoribonuclease-2